MPPKSAALLLVPYGIHNHMGHNMKQIAALSQRRVHIWHNTDIRRAQFKHNIFLNGSQLSDKQTAEHIHSNLGKNGIDEWWKNNYLSAWTFFTGQDTIVDVDAVLATAQKEFDNHHLQS